MDRGLAPGLWLTIWLLGVNLLAASPAPAALLNFVEAQIDGVGGVNGLNQASAVSVSPDGKHVYATGAGDSAVAVFNRNFITGRLTFVEAQVDGTAGVQGLGGATAIAASPDGRHVYVAGNTDSALAAFARDATTGALTFVEAKVNGSDGVTGLGGASSVAISPDGTSVYVTGRNDSSLAVFARDATTGHLTNVEVQVNGSAGVDGLGGALSAAVAPDGANVYVVGRSQDALTTFTRSATAGALVFDGMLAEGTNGLVGLKRPSAVTVEPGGEQVYVASFDEDITVFSRAAETGELAFLQNANVLPGGPTALAVSPDGTRVYVPSYVRSTRSELNVFTRRADGTVAFVETEANGSAGVEGINGASGVAVSPDGRTVYVTGRSDNAVVVFFATPACVGDCSGDGTVTVDELLIGVSIALGETALSRCPDFDGDGDGCVTIGDILAAINAALSRCD
jgi:6-phosphogluconolactonase (cycloisomerase 2 family)